MSKLMGIVVSAVAVVLLLAACGQESTADSEAASGDTGGGSQTASFQDGIYMAGEAFDPQSDWRNIVILEVSDGRIVSAEWTAAPRTGGPDKLTHSSSGDYGMERVAEWPWHEQAQAVAEHLLQTQDPTDIELKDDGRTDAISGATMTVSYFFELAQQALADGPVGGGPYVDGAYYAEADEPGQDWHDAVHITVINGYIASVHWAPLPVDGERNKYRYSADGDYGMERVAQWPWHEQADALTRHILETQQIRDIPLGDDGKTDAISGATISIRSFVDVASKAIAEAEA